MKPLALLLLFSLLASTPNEADPAQALMAYKGTWVIFKTKDGFATRDTLCKTTATWLQQKQQLVAAQVIWGDNGITTDSCFYAYDAAKKAYTYYETEAGKTTATSDIAIAGNTWTYNHHINSTKNYRTLNVFNDKGDEITYRSQRSEDGGQTWVTTREGKECRVSR